MIYFQTKKHQPTMWHLGEPFPLGKAIDVLELQADGDELTYILDHYRNLPHTDASVQIWTGCLAQFITANLRLLDQVQTGEVA